MSRPNPNPTERGLRSVQSIRWLLVMGALVTVVSVYRLVESQWSLLSAAAQFSTLAAGTLLLYGAGRLVRRRLHLPHAGTALLFSFTALVPVLSWGAAYLDLLDSGAGWVVFVLGMALLLLATAGVWQETLGYRGHLFHWSFGGLTLALPLLPRAASLLPLSRESADVFLAIVLGGVLLGGSRSINRFLFHRDRRDGIDRPLSLVPFLVLGLLYAAAILVLEPQASVAALPLMCVGIVFAETGEEYYRALFRSGQAPERWPARSVALLSVGLAMIAASLILAGRMPHWQHAMTVYATAAWFFLLWALRYQSVLAHVSGLVSAFSAYHLAVRGVGLERLLAAATAVPSGSPALIAWSHLGLQAGLFGWMALLRSRRASVEMQQAHDLGIFILAVGMVGASCVDVEAAAVVLPAVTLLFFAGLFLSRSAGSLLAGLFALGSTVLAVSARLFETTPLANPPLTLLLLVFGGVALAISRYERPLAVLLRQPLWLARHAILLSAVVAAGFAGLAAAASPTWQVANAVNVVLSGALLLWCGYQLPHRGVLTAGVLLSSLGAHGFVGLTYGVPSASLALLTNGLFAASALLSALARSERDLMKPAARLSTWLHGGLALTWLALAAGSGNVSVEPLIVALLGMVLVARGIQEELTGNVGLGLMMVAIYPPLHLAWLEVLTSWPAFLTLALVDAYALLLAFRSGRLFRASAGSQPVVEPGERVVRLLGLLSLGTAGILAGSPSLILSLVLLGLIVIEKRDQLSPVTRLAVVAPASCFAVIVQGAVALAGGAEGFLLPVMLERLPGIALPLAALLLAWLLMADSVPGAGTPERQEIDSFRTAAGAFLLASYVLAWVSPESMTSLEHLGLLTLAVVSAVRHGYRSLGSGRAFEGFLVQVWVAAGVMQAVDAGWVHFHSGSAPYVLFGSGLLEQLLAVWIGRRPKGEGLAVPSRFAAQFLVAGAGLYGLSRSWPLPPGVSDWVSLLPIFLASLFFLVLASEGYRRAGPAIASAGFLAAGLLCLVSSQGLGSEFYGLGPGLALIMLSLLLREKMGPSWSGHVFAAGAACLYAIPVLSLYDQLAWSWQAVLAVLAIVFGTTSFGLRSRSLLTVSTAALLVDLGCFVLKVRETEPLLLWVGGVGFGIALMGVATYLEHRREGLLQQIRVFGRELQCWH